MIVRRHELHAEPGERESAIAAFILECSGDAYKLKELIDRRNGHGELTLVEEELAVFLTKKIEEEFRIKFGSECRPMCFDKSAR